LWGDRPPAAAGAALSVLISKVRSAVGPDVLRGRSELFVTLPERAQVDVEAAASALHAAESAIARRDWRRAWTVALTAQFVARRRFLPEADTAWAESWRRRFGETRARALECYATACLELGGAELPGAERAARELLDVAPLRETGHLLLMRTLAARGNVAEALSAYDRLRVLLREQLGVDPSRAVQNTYVDLLT
jgi:DNA-binding SARP family transcriptional activator